VTFAEAEVARCLMTFTIAAEEARKQHGELLDMDALPPGEGHFGLARRFPLGVIGAITPFNFPLNLVAHKVAPCLATGNTMVVKPATKTPLTALLLAEVLVEAGMPEGQVNFVTCSNEDASLLVTDKTRKKDHLHRQSSRGLAAQGNVREENASHSNSAATPAASSMPMRIWLRPLPMIALGGFAQAGQSCISVQRIFVQEAIYDVFRNRLNAHIAEKIKTGDPRERSTVVGPMITLDALAKNPRAHRRCRGCRRPDRLRRQRNWQLHGGDSHRECPAGRRTLRR